MVILLGIDIGTTTITALALDAATGAIRAVCTTANQSETTRPDDKAKGRSEWDVQRMGEQARAALRTVAEQLAGHANELTGLGITGQQHGVVVVDSSLAPLTPFINWQDRRGEEIDSQSGKSFVALARERVGSEAPSRAGCRLATGYMAITLFWLRQHGLLPSAGTACFVMDYFGALLTGQTPVTDGTCGASSGAFDLRAGSWDAATLSALGLPRSLFPEVGASGARLGTLSAKLAEATGLPAGLPIFACIGDNQASFLGSVGDRSCSILVNVGTGGQVAAYTPEFASDPRLETRPFPHGGFLLVSAGLSGGASYAVLERFYRNVATQLLGAASIEPLYEAMNRLAAAVPRGAAGLRCEPFFSGTRAQPELRASWTGISTENLTPAHLTRALLEGMARAFREGFERIAGTGRCRGTQLVGAGNGLRANPVLADIVAEEFGLPLKFPSHREEAAVGAALLAGVGAGVFPNLDVAGRLIRYEGERP